MNDFVDIGDLYSDEMLKAIGCLIVMSAMTEQALSFQLARLMAHPNGIDPGTLVSLRGGEVKVKLQQIVTISRFKVNKENLPEVIRICNKIRNAFDRRNDLTHNASIQENEDLNKIVLKMIRMKNDGSKQPDKEYTAKQITDFSYRMRSLVYDLDKALMEAGIERIHMPR